MIFGAVARSYYDKGMSVIPLHRGQKKPYLEKWSQYCVELPDAETQADWIKRFEDHNIGLACGPQSRFVAIDIDSTDEALIQKILAFLPPSPWVRRGKKGMVLGYRFNGIGTFRLKDSEGNSILEHISTGGQIVLPPSIHPDTKMPYTSNCDLWDVIDTLPVLDSQIEQLIRGFLKSQGVELSLQGWTKVTEWTAAGNRDVQMIRVAGLQAQGVVRGELTLKAAMDNMLGWAESSVQHVAGDEIDINKGIHRMVDFIRRDVLQRNKILPKGWDDDLTAAEKQQFNLNFSVDAVEWSYEEMKNHLIATFRDHPDEDSVNRRASIDFVLKKISQSKGLSAGDTEKVLRYIADSSTTKIPISALRADVRKMGQGEVVGMDHTEIAKAVLEDLKQKNEWAFQNGQFWKWNGSYWQQQNNHEIMEVIATEYGGYPAAKKYSDHRGILQIVATLMPQDICQEQITAVNFANGVLREDRKLYPHDSRWGMTYMLPFRYLPEEGGKCSKFMEFLERSWGPDPDKEDKKQLLQEMLCATMFNMTPMLQKAFLLKGLARTGKSQLVDIVKALVPPDAQCVCPPDTWHDKFAPTHMHKKLLNVANELSEVKRLDGTRFKDIIDGNDLMMQLKGGQIFSAPARPAHWFTSNHLPKSDDTSNGFIRRWAVLIFNNPVPPGEIKFDYGKTIAAEEREGIAAWAVEALPRLLINRRLTEPQSHKEAIAEMANLNNPVRYFLTESPRVKFSKRQGDSMDQMPPLMTKKELEGIPHTFEGPLYQAYSAHCVGEGGVRDVGRRAFRQKVRDLAHDLEFRMTTCVGDLGLVENVYLFITVADKLGR